MIIETVYVFLEVKKRSKWISILRVVVLKISYKLEMVKTLLTLCFDSKLWTITEISMNITSSYSCVHLSSKSCHYLHFLSRQWPFSFLAHFFPLSSSLHFSVPIFLGRWQETLTSADDLMQPLRSKFNRIKAEVLMLNVFSPHSFQDRQPAWPLKPHLSHFHCSLNIADDVSWMWDPEMHFPLSQDI